MRNKDLLYLRDISGAIELIQDYICDLTEEQFTENIEKQDSVVRRLEIIGEASNHISQKLKDQYTKLPWKEMIGLRNRLVHEYFGIDILKVWDVVLVELPKIYSSVQQIIQKLDE
jgi:uncharacterized protein with HEPN domain